MYFTNLSLNSEYRTFRDDIVHDFYTPLLKRANLYKRAVGFFSSSALLEASKGLAGLIKNDGRIMLIVSPKLQEDDIEAIEKGYEARDAILEKAILNAFEEPKNYFEQERLNILATLIAEGRLDIKIAFTENHKSVGMYHEKIGIIYDLYGNKVAFTGSMNETGSAFSINYESIDVFCSWIDGEEKRVIDKEKAFDTLWENKEFNVKVIDFPKAAKEKLQSYKRDQVQWDIDEHEFPEILKQDVTTNKGPFIPEVIELHSYQLDAINQWEKQEFRGIFDMATGTGKTYTGLGAVAHLYKKNSKRLAVIIVCPYQHLVEQWVEDIVKFNMHPTIGYSASVQRDWKKRLSNDILDFKIGVIDTFCFVTTNATFSSEFVRKQLDKLGKDTLLMIDEAHNFGAYNLSQTLNPKFEYRLALSATLERHGDEEGTQALYNYFGEKCIEYGLERAIREDKLTSYYYYPKVVYLTDDELIKYRELSIKIAKQYHAGKDGKFEVTDLGKKLLIERSRLIAGAVNKIEMLKELMQNYKCDTHMLVYCGAARTYDPTMDQSDMDDEGERQIVSVSKMLGLELGMKVTHFTSAESAAEREKIKKQFAEADPYQAIVAIKCLDEGVNIPSIKTAFILASSTNPKEYVQRRGRVLRKAPNKLYATIFDFVTLPTYLDYVNCYSQSAQMDLSLIRKEVARMKEFGEISKNPSESDKLIKELSEIYGLDLLDRGDDFDE